jgi:vitamin B12/bleomycin/antimicrobial peptide transport system ATP-binding/permease protein
MSESIRLSITTRSVLRQVWALTKPYWFSEERWAARGLLAAVVALNLGLVFITVLINKWNNDFFNALQNKDRGAFSHQLIVWLVLAATYLVGAVYQLNLNMWLQIRWRRWLTNVYFGEWLDKRVYYRLELKNHGTDNPDQRLQEDLKLFTTNTLSLALSLLRAVVSLFSFVLICGRSLAPWHSHSAACNCFVPGYMVWAALCYAIGGTWIAHKIGRPLIRLNFEQQKYEADLRYALTRLRENAEGIALYHGELDERDTLLTRFASVWKNWWSLIQYQKRLIGFTAFYEQLASVFPFVVAAPRYFAGSLQLGGLMQTASAFGRVQDALSWFTGAYAQLAEWRATVDRLTGFHDAITAAGNEVATGAAITVQANGNAEVTARELTLALPDGNVLVDGINTRFKQGEHVLVTGPSGCGKSTLFRALAGIWPFGAGTVQTPANGAIMFLPQKPYLPLSALRDVVAYPHCNNGLSDAQIAKTLKLCRLEQFAHRLGERDNWALRLSPGEQQRLAIARALLNKPAWLFLDESTAAVDEETERYLYQLLRHQLPTTTLVSIAHRPAPAANHLY